MGWSSTKQESYSHFAVVAPELAASALLICCKRSHTSLSHAKGRLHDPGSRRRTHLAVALKELTCVSDELDYNPVRISQSSAVVVCPSELSSRTNHARPVPWLGTSTHGRLRSTDRIDAIESAQRPDLRQPRSLRSPWSQADSPTDEPRKQSRRRRSGLAALRGGIDPRRSPRSRRWCRRDTA